ncbi:MAG: glutamate-5-semialdehyde dehydrogenase [Cyanobacteria bacterium SIG30]|nr:glutamate-5-semialdehyde dehydrogenase [Cyanobacteria bacterium SIG30]
MSILEILKGARNASLSLAGLKDEIKNQALLAIADKLENNLDIIFEANKKDLEGAKNISKSVFNRLKLDENKARDMIQGIRDIAKLENPVNKILWKKELDDHLILTKITCPIGVIGVIFEARPDVISQISSLAIKSSNAVILKGGSESVNLNTLIVKLINEALLSVSGFPQNAINLIYSHEDVAELLSFDEYVNLIIPRGSNSLVKYIKENTKIPVLGHASGICHIFVDIDADFEKAKKIIIDSKTQYPSACNSVETVLVHKDYSFKKELIEEIKNFGVEIVESPEDWSFEYGEKTMSLKEVSSLDEAIEHINKYSSGHTECIITENIDNAQIFMNLIDSSGVYHNASTRFADGFRYGFGAEVGISTNKIHARGPVGLEGLTIYKYLLQGNGQIVDDYVKGDKKFTHKLL